MKKAQEGAASATVGREFRGGRGGAIPTPLIKYSPPQSDRKSFTASTTCEFTVYVPFYHINFMFSFTFNVFSINQRQFNGHKRIESKSTGYEPV
jgi:uncharacterized membrane protein